ncbi:MAG TPA: MFS transporter [Acidimicrobiales bacterium]|nr:MFS transporter [Acidimicrobiales bacterium]
MCPPSDQLDDVAAARREPWPAELRARVRQRAGSDDRYRWWVLAVVLVGLFSVNVLFTVFVVALPSVAQGLHTSLPTVTWVVTGPMLAYAVFAPIAGKAGDRLGHRRLYLTALAANLGIALLSATAPSVGVLITARVLGGLDGAALGATSMALVLGAFAKGDRVKAMGWWSLVGAGGPVVGVAVGGFIIQSIGWRWMFMLELGIGVVALVLAAIVLPEFAVGRGPGSHAGRRVDVAGAVFVVLGVGSLLFALNRAPVLGWGSSTVVGAFALAAVALATLVPVELRAEDPLVPLRWLRRRNFAFPIGAQMGANFAYMGGFFLAPLILEQVYGKGESAAGLLVIPRPLTFSLCAPIAGYVAVRVGERTTAVTGTLAVFVSMLVFAMTGHDTGVALVEVGLVLSGIGMGVSSPSLGASVANAVEQDSLGTASATQQLMAQIATISGIQVMQTVQSARARMPGVSLLDSFHTAYLVGAAVALGGVACAALLRSTDRRQTALEPGAPRIGTERVPALAGVDGMGELLAADADGLAGRALPDQAILDQAMLDDGFPAPGAAGTGRAGPRR